MLMYNKKGQTGGLITNLVMGIAGLVIGVIIAFVIVQTLSTSDLLTDSSMEDNSTALLRGNFSEGIDNISGKIPTVLLVSAIVLILAVMVLLIGAWRRMGTGGASI
jgi:hypothetical protein